MEPDTTLETLLASLAGIVGAGFVLTDDESRELAYVSFPGLRRTTTGSPTPRPSSAAALPLGTATSKQPLLPISATIEASLS